jgi:hypothetical protein
MGWAFYGSGLAQERDYGSRTGVLTSGGKAGYSRDPAIGRMQLLS